MKKVYLLFVAMLLLVSAFGQKNKDKLHLKNGTILNGKINILDSGDIQIESAGNVWVFTSNEIENIAYSKKSMKNATEEFSNKFFDFHTEIGVLVGNNDNSQSAPFIFQTSINYNYSEKLSLGIGSGIEYFNETHLPLFGNIEYKFRHAKFSPYAYLQAGYVLAVEDSRTYYYDVVPGYYSYSSSIWPGPWYDGENELDAKGGILLNPGIGIRTMFNSNFGMTFSFGYRFSRLKYTGDLDYKLLVDYNRLSLKLGIIFN